MTNDSLRPRTALCSDERLSAATNDSLHRWLRSAVCNESGRSALTKDAWTAMRNFVGLNSIKSALIYDMAMIVWYCIYKCSFTLTIQPWQTTLRRTTLHNNEQLSITTNTLCNDKRRWGGYMQQQKMIWRRTLCNRSEHNVLKIGSTTIELFKNIYIRTVGCDDCLWWFVTAVASLLYSNVPRSNWTSNGLPRKITASTTIATVNQIPLLFVCL